MLDVRETLKGRKVSDGKNDKTCTARLHAAGCWLCPELCNAFLTVIRVEAEHHFGCIAASVGPFGILRRCAGEESGCAGTSAVRSWHMDAAACAVSGLGVGTVLARHRWLQHTDVLFTVDVFEFRSIGICFSYAGHNGVAVLRDRLGLHVCRQLSGMPPETEKRITLREKKKTLMKTSPASACENIRRPSCFSRFILL